MPKYYDRPKTVFEALRTVQHDEDFEPRESEEFSPTEAWPGSSAKIDVLAARVSQGLPLWHQHDKIIETDPNPTNTDGLRVLANPLAQRKKHLA